MNTVDYRNDAINEESAGTRVDADSEDVATSLKDDEHTRKVVKLGA